MKISTPDTPFTSEVEYEHFRADHRLPVELDGFGEFGEREHVTRVGDPSTFIT